jgi:pimeloyl-ACP methyl ester carboxylesterase
VSEFELYEYRHVLTRTEQIIEHRFPGAMFDTGRALLCVPGYAATGESFARLRPLAADFDVRLLTIHAARGGNIINQYAALLARYADDFERPVLLGTSFGGLVALRAAAQLRRRISGLVLISTYAAVTSHLRRLLIETGVATAIEHAAAHIPGIAYALLGSKRLDDAAAQELSRERTSIDRREKRERFAAAIRADVRHAAARLRVPTLIIHGGADRVVPVSAAHELARLIPDSSIVIIGRAGHLPYLTHPGEVNALLGSFLKARFATRRAVA